MTENTPNSIITTDPDPGIPPFTTHPSISRFKVPYPTYLTTLFQQHPSTPIAVRWVGVGALAFDRSDRVLLVQRAATDSMPNLWEIPGGGCDEDDPSILHSVVRELKEESGLTATAVGPMVHLRDEGEEDGGDLSYVFLTRSRKIVAKFNFLVAVELESSEGQGVRLDPEEHQAFLWADEEEVKAGRVGEFEVRFTTKEQREVILRAFAAWRMWKPEIVKNRQEPLGGQGKEGKL